jgi:hypothetical protein
MTNHLRITLGKSVNYVTDTFCKPSFEYVPKSDGGDLGIGSGVTLLCKVSLHRFSRIYDSLEVEPLTCGLSNG